ncbi:MAG: helix-turn-helix transcriptional regulator [Planctomycetes bacterium]|nr:helix-turn-helix transcriptional regulator [Planctomycetota bacterium]
MELRPLVLAILEARPLYGYEIAQRARRRANLRWEEGTLYPLLHRLERDGFLSSAWRKAPNGKDRKYYGLTRKGKTALAKERADWKEQVRVVSELLLGGRHGKPGRSAP